MLNTHFILACLNLSADIINPHDIITANNDQYDHGFLKLTTVFSE